MEESQILDWHQLDDMPVGHWEPASLVLDGKLVVLGGYEDYVTSSKRVDLFDPADGSWTQLQDMPSAVGHVNLVEHDGSTRVVMLSIRMWVAASIRLRWPGTL